VAQTSGVLDGLRALARLAMPRAVETPVGKPLRSLHAAERGALPDAGVGTLKAGKARRRRPRQAVPTPNTAGQALSFAGRGLTALLAVGGAGAAAYSCLRDPVNFRQAPMRTTLANMMLLEPMAPDALSSGRRLVLDRFGKYIPPKAPCHGVVPSVSFDVPISNAGGFILAKEGNPGVLRFNPYQNRGGSRHAVVHEYLHCFTSARFTDSVMQGNNRIEILEGLTEHFADSVPGDPASKRTAYDPLVMENGKSMVGTAAELERIVGKKALRRAYLGGDPAAISKVSRSAVDLYPKKPSTWVWLEICDNMPRRVAPKAAECLIAASLIDCGRLPPEQFLRVPVQGLPLRRFADITAKQKRQLREQGLAVRDRLGASWNQAFYNFDHHVGLPALARLSADLEKHWRPVLTGRA
jgi:hypothetical protein